MFNPNIVNKEHITKISLWGPIQRIRGIMINDQFRHNDTVGDRVEINTIQNA